jgi:hypothetical protein
VPDEALTEKQESRLAWAVRTGGWWIGGRGGFSVARGLEQRGLVRVERSVDRGRLSYRMVPTKAGREYALRSGRS